MKRVLAEEPVPLRFVRRFPPYHEIPGRRDGRAAVVALHADGWSAKAIAGYLRVGTSTVYRILKRWAEQGPDGLEDRPHGRPPGVRKVTLKAMEAIRRFQENPNLGEFRIHAALAQIGIHLSPRTCGRILALNRELYGLEKPKGPVKEKREMPFRATRRHQFWSSDVRYIDDHGLGGRAYVVSVLDNHSRAILASAVTRTQDLASYLSVLYAAVVVCTQMAKTGVLAVRIGGDYVPDLHLVVGDDHPVDQKLHQPAPLLEGGALQSALHSGAEISYGIRHAGQFHALVGLRLQLPLLALQRLVLSLQFPAASAVLRQRDHLTEVGFGKPVDLAFQGGPAFAKVFLAGLELLRQPLSAVRSLQSLRDGLGVGEDLAEIAPDHLVELLRRAVAGGAVFAFAGPEPPFLAGADVGVNA